VDGIYAGAGAVVVLKDNPFKTQVQGLSRCEETLMVIEAVVVKIWKRIEIILPRAYA
jgi:hypothetical protein